MNLPLNPKSVELVANSVRAILQGLASCSIASASEQIAGLEMVIAELETITRTAPYSDRSGDALNE